MKKHAAIKRKAIILSHSLANLKRVISSFSLHKLIDGIVSSGTSNNAGLSSCKQLGVALVNAAIDRVAMLLG